MNDEDWLFARLYQPSVAEVERFCERIAIKMADGMDELTARAEALKELHQARARR